MNTETENMVAFLIRIFKERETMSEMSKEYAVITQDILFLENILIARGIDTAKILWDIVDERG